MQKWIRRWTKICRAMESATTHTHTHIKREKKKGIRMNGKMGKRKKGHFSSLLVGLVDKICTAMVRDRTVTQWSKKIKDEWIECILLPALWVSTHRPTHIFSKAQAHILCAHIGDTISQTTGRLYWAPLQTISLHFFFSSTDFHTPTHRRTQTHRARDTQHTLSNRFSHFPWGAIIYHCIFVSFHKLNLNDSIVFRKNCKFSSAKNILRDNFLL